MTSLDYAIFLAAYVTSQRRAMLDCCRHATSRFMRYSTKMRARGVGCAAMRQPAYAMRFSALRYARGCHITLFCLPYVYHGAATPLSTARIMFRHFSPPLRFDALYCRCCRRLFSRHMMLSRAERAKERHYSDDVAFAADDGR